MSFIYDHKNVGYHESDAVPYRRHFGARVDKKIMPT